MSRRWLLPPLVLLLLPPATPEQPADDLAQDRFASFFDTVVIPARQQQLIDLDPRVDVSSETASELQECSLDSQTGCCARPTTGSSSWAAGRRG